jgi:hypothetical protein
MRPLIGTLNKNYLTLDIQRPLQKKIFYLWLCKCPFNIFLLVPLIKFQWVKQKNLIAPVTCTFYFYKVRCYQFNFNGAFLILYMSQWNTPLNLNSACTLQNHFSLFYSTMQKAEMCFSACLLVSYSHISCVTSTFSFSSKHFWQQFFRWLGSGIPYRFCFLHF